MMEALRRILALILVVSGGYFFLWPGEKVLIVQPEDFQKGYARHAKREGENKLSLEGYILSATEERRRSVSGSEWLDLAKLLSSSDSSPEVRARQLGYSHDYFVFNVDEVPFAELSFTLESSYLNIDGGPYWLRVRAEYPQEVSALPDSFSHPLRWMGLSLFVAGLFIYFILPRKKHAPDAIVYPRGTTVILPDLLGLGFAVFFGLIPCIVLWENEPGQSLLDPSGGWIFMTIAFWVMAAFAFAFLKVGYQYSSLSYRLGSDGLREINGSRETFFKWNEIESFQSYEKRTSSKVARLLILFGGSFQAVGLGLVLDGNNECGIYVKDCEGNRLKIMKNALDAFDDIVAALKEHGVKRGRKITE